MKNPLDARCVFVSGPVALFLHEDTPEGVRRGLADVTRYAETFIEGLTPAVSLQTNDHEGPQLKVEGIAIPINLTQEEYIRWFAEGKTPGSILLWNGQKVWAHRPQTSYSWILL